MDELRAKKRENLIKINDWCSELIGNSELYLKLPNAFRCNNRMHAVHVHKGGISVIADGKFSSFLRVRAGSDSLFDTKAGTELILNWKNIKTEIIRTKEKALNDRKAIMDFEV